MDRPLSRGAAVRVLAELFEGVESVSPYGGQAISWEPLGPVWLKTGKRRRREKTDVAGTRTTEFLTGEARADPRLTLGRVLRFGGADWRIAGCETVGGQAILTLERAS